MRYFYRKVLNSIKKYRKLDQAFKRTPFERSPFRALEPSRDRARVAKHAVKHNFFFLPTHMKALLGRADAAGGLR